MRPTSATGRSMKTLEPLIKPAVSLLSSFSRFVIPLAHRAHHVLTTLCESFSPVVLDRIGNLHFVLPGSDLHDCRSQFAYAPDDDGAVRPPCQWDCPVYCITVPHVPITVQ